MPHPADSGDGGTSQGNPSQLHASGLVFQRFANGISGIAETDVLQSDGGAGRWSVEADDANVGADTTELETLLASASNGFVSFLIAAEPQFADAAIDLFDCAGDFATADQGQVPAGASPAGNVGGVQTWRRDDGDDHDVWAVDDEGHLYHQSWKGNDIDPGGVL